MTVRRVIHRADPFSASQKADAQGRAMARAQPERVAYFAGREVMNRDGSFPLGEGFLYEKAQPRARDPGFANGTGLAGEFAVAGHRGSKPQQQDAFNAVRFSVGGKDVTALAVADGVSASGRLAAPASKRAVAVFLERFEKEMARLPDHESKRHAHVEKAMERAAFAANFEVVRLVLLDRAGDGRFDAGDKTALKRLSGTTLPTGRLTLSQMQRLAPQLDQAVEALDEKGRSALATFAVAVTVDNDLYTFSSGDAVVNMFRPSEAEGHRLVQLTHRDQEVVDLFMEGGDAWRSNRGVHENIITDSLGDAGRVSGTLRRYPNLLQPGDRLVVASDGLGPRGGSRGLDRNEIEEVLSAHPGPEAARALVRAQVADMRPDEYQDNIGIAVLDVEPRTGG